MFVGQPPLQSGPCVFSEGDCAAMDVLAANRSNNEERSGFLRMFKVSHGSREGKRIACSGSITVVTSPLASSTGKGVRRGSQTLPHEFDSHPRLQFPQLRPQKKPRHTQNRGRSSESGRMNIRKHTPTREIIWAGAAIRCTATRTRSKRTQESMRWIVARRQCFLAAPGLRRDQLTYSCPMAPSKNCAS